MEALCGLLSEGERSEPELSSPHTRLNESVLRIDFGACCPMAEKKLPPSGG